MYNPGQNSYRSIRNERMLRNRSKDKDAPNYNHDGTSITSVQRSESTKPTNRLLKLEKQSRPVSVTTMKSVSSTKTRVCVESSQIINNKSLNSSISKPPIRRTLSSKMVTENILSDNYFEREKENVFDTGDYARALEEKLINSQVNDKQIEIDAMKKIMRSVETKLNKATVTIEELNIATRELKNENESIQEQLKQKTEEYINLQIYYNDIKCDYDNINRKYNECEQTLTKLNQQITCYELENTELESKANNYYQLYESEIENNKNSVEKLELEKQFLQEQLDNLEGTLEEYYNEQGQTQENVQLLHEENALLRKKTQDLEEIIEKHNNKKSTIKDKNTELTNKQERLESRLHELQELNAQYKDKNKTTESRLNELEKLSKDTKQKYTELDRQNKLLLSSKKEFEKKAKISEEKLFVQNRQIDEFKAYAKRLENYLLKNNVDLNGFYDAEENIQKEPKF